MESEEFMAKQVRVLHVLGSTNLGGAESRIMDLYRHIDRERVQFDFLVHTEKEGHFDKEIEQMGGRVYRVPRFRIYNYFSYVKAIKHFFEEHHDFTVVQGHMTSTAAIYLPIAKKAGVIATVAHARSAGVDKGLKGDLTKWFRRNLPQKTDYMFTCSEIAGRAVFGNKAVEEGKTIFIPNAIACDDFTDNEKMRLQIRKELQAENKYIIGHVGRFHYAKNHEYLLRLFAEIVAKGDKDYMLLLLGEGGGVSGARELAVSLGIADKVYFAGNKTNVYDYYQAMDYFVYPSRYEGLPGTVVEAQAAGLRCLISDSICKEVMVTELVHDMSITLSPVEWAEYVIATQEYDRVDCVKEMKQAGFDVEQQAEKMMNFYEIGKWV